MDTAARPRRFGILYAEESGSGFRHPYFSQILNAVRHEAEAHGYDITFVNEEVITNGENCLEHCRDLELDGICFVCADYSSPQIRALVKSGIPCVTVDHFFRGVPSVISDNETGVQKLVEYAISRGHRRIAFIHGQNNSIVTRSRMHQFHNTMAFHGLPVPAEYFREGKYHGIEITRNIVTELLNLPEAPSCILLPDDITYLGAQDAAREMYLHIPKDVSFAGYDGINLSQALEPKLTTIRQSCEQIGLSAARILIQVIENPKAVSRLPVVFPVQFIEGGTIGTVESV